MLTDLPSFSFVICASDDRYERRLRNCLDSLVSQEMFPELRSEIVICAVHGAVDADESPKLESLSREFGARFFRTPYESPAYNFAYARNVGADLAKNEVLCFIDPDIVLHPTILPTMIEAVVKGRSFCVSLAGYSTENTEFKYVGVPAKNFDRHLKSLRVGPHSHGGFFAVFSEDFHSINGYDEVFYGWGGPDNDICYRLKDAGFHMGVLPQNVIHQWHPPRCTQENEHTARNREYLKNCKGVVRNPAGYGLLGARRRFCAK